MVEPSCPIVVILEDGDFRKSLIRALDERNFSVTFAPDGDRALEVLRGRNGFRVAVVGLDLQNRIGLTSLEFLREHHRTMDCSVIIVGEPDPAARTFAPWAEEMLLRPVDPHYVATRARVYCT
jgi:ActR/RegA family two-component response regulator